MATRDDIAATIRRLNEAENNRPNQSVEATSAGIDRVMADNVEGWSNGVHVPNREAERRTEAMIFGLLEDYHRVLDLEIIEPPYASIGWTITGTANGQPVAIQGCSNFEMNDEGLVRRYWLYCDSAQFASMA